MEEEVAEFIPCLVLSCLKFTDVHYYFQDELSNLRASCMFGDISDCMIHFYVSYHDEYKRIIERVFEDPRFMRSKRKFLSKIVIRCLKMCDHPTYFNFLLTCAFIGHVASFCYMNSKCYRVAENACKCAVAVFERKFRDLFRRGGGLIGLWTYSDGLNKIVGHLQNHYVYLKDIVSPFFEGKRDVYSLLSACEEVDSTKFVLTDFEKKLLYKVSSKRLRKLKPGIDCLIHRIPRVYFETQRDQGSRNVIRDVVGLNLVNTESNLVNTESNRRELGSLRDGHSLDAPCSSSCRSESCSSPIYYSLQKDSESSNQSIIKKQSETTNCCVDGKEFESADCCSIQKEIEPTNICIPEKQSESSNCCITEKQSEPSNCCITEKQSESSNCCINEKQFEPSNCYITEKQFEPSNCYITEEQSEPLNCCINEKQSEPSNSCINEKKSEPSNSSINEKQSEPSNSCINEKQSEPSNCSITEIQSEQLNYCIPEKQSEPSNCCIIEKDLEPLNYCITKRVSELSITKTIPEGSPSPAYYRKNRELQSTNYETSIEECKSATRSSRKLRRSSSDKTMNSELSKLEDGTSLESLQIAASPVKDGLPPSKMPKLSNSPRGKYGPSQKPSQHSSRDNHQKSMPMSFPSHEDKSSNAKICSSEMGSVAPKTSFHESLKHSDENGIQKYICRSFSHSNHLQFKLGLEEKAPSASKDNTSGNTSHSVQGQSLPRFHQGKTLTAKTTQSEVAPLTSSSNHCDRSPNRDSIHPLSSESSSSSVQHSSKDSLPETPGNTSHSAEGQSLPRFHQNNPLTTNTTQSEVDPPSSSSNDYDRGEIPIYPLPSESSSSSVQHSSEGYFTSESDLSDGHGNEEPQSDLSSSLASTLTNTGSLPAESEYFLADWEGDTCLESLINHKCFHCGTKCFNYVMYVFEQFSRHFVD